MKSAARNTMIKNGPPIGQVMHSATTRSDGGGATKPTQPKIAGFGHVHLDLALVNSGIRLAGSMFNNRDFSPMKRYIDDANNMKNTHVRACGLSVLIGVGRCLSDILRQSSAKGHVRFSGDTIPNADEITYAFKTDAEYFSGLMNTLVKTAQQVGQASSARASFDERAAEPSKNDGPMKVEVVSMPPRETVTSIIHNADGNIVGSTQLQKDIS